MRGLSHGKIKKTPACITLNTLISFHIMTSLNTITFVRPNVITHVGKIYVYPKIWETTVQEAINVHFRFLSTRHATLLGRGDNCI